MLRRKKSQSTVVIEDESNKSLFKAKNWFGRHKKTTIAIVIASVILVAGGTATALYFYNQKNKEPVATKPAPKPEKPAAKYYSLLTGALVENEAATKQPVTAVMLENSPDARPQSGLKSSGVVFEAIAEGGITRFLALYQEQKPALVGPVRSLRMYYVDWLAPFNASVAHVGGSAAALAEIRNGNYRDIDQFFNAGAYWRATDRYAPHNVYTNFEKIDALNKAKGYTSSEFTGFNRADSKAAAEPTATQINVTISSSLYNSTYAYNAETNTYNRSQAGTAHLDREEGQISPRTVVVMKVKQQRVLEDGWREQINAIGSGTAYVFQDGIVKEINWKKETRGGQIIFTDAEGATLPLARGQTWITAVPEGTGGATWK